MTDEIAIPPKDAQPGAMVWLKPVKLGAPYKPLNHRFYAETLYGAYWLDVGQIHRITRPISTEDALRAEVEQLKAQLEALKQSYDVVRAQAVAPPPSEQDQ